MFQAMATDVLPDENEFAKDMGVWSLSLVLPQVVAVPVASSKWDKQKKSTKYQS